MPKPIFDPWFHATSTAFEAAGIGGVALGVIVAATLFIIEGVSLWGHDTAFKKPASCLRLALVPRQ